MCLLEGALHVHDVYFVVFDQKDIQRLRSAQCGRAHRFIPVPGFFAQVNRKIEPFSGEDSSTTFPPRLSTIFFTTDSPIPVPSTLSLGASVWNTPHTRSWYSAAMPGPLSRTENS